MISLCDLLTRVACMQGAGEEIDILTGKKVDDVRGKLKPPISPATEDRFDLPQPEYQEDK